MSGARGVREKSLEPAQEMVTLQASCVLHLVTHGSSQDKAVPPAFIPSPKATPGLPLWDESHVQRQMNHLK